MTIWKIIIEVVLAFLSFGMGYTFWSCIKSPKYLGRILTNKNETKNYISTLGKERLMESTRQSGKFPKGFNHEELLSKGLSHEQLLLITIQSSIKAVDGGRNLAAFILLIVFIVSYFLSSIFLIINVACFLIMYFPQISSSAKNNIYNDLNSITRIICKWYLTDPSGCENFCLSKPRFRNIYEAIILEMTNDTDTLLKQKLKGSNFEFVKGVMQDVLHLAYNEGKAKGGAYVMKKELLEATENFIHNPCIDTAFILVKTYPDSLKNFEDSKNPLFKQS